MFRITIAGKQNNLPNRLSVYILYISIDKSQNTDKNDEALFIKCQKNEKLNQNRIEIKTKTKTSATKQVSGF